MARTTGPELIHIMQAHLRVLSQLLAWSNNEFDSSQAALQELSEIVRTEIGYAQFGIGLIGEDGLLHFTAGYGIPARLRRTLTVAPGQGVVGQVLKRGAPLCIQDVRQEPRYRGLLAETRAEICVPLRTRAHILGAINVESPQVYAFDERDLQLLTALANGASGVLARLQRQERAQTAHLEIYARLSPREKQVLHMLMQRQSNAAIAHALQIQEHTVEHHVTTLLKKLELSSRHAAGEWARTHRLFDKM